MLKAPSADQIAKPHWAAKANSPSLPAGLGLHAIRSVVSQVAGEVTIFRF
jgi:hypothetical protein